MLELFLPSFFAAITFIVILMFTLKEDLTRKTHRPLYLMVFIIGFWFMTWGALVAPEPITSQYYPPQNIIITNASSTDIVIVQPGYFQNTTSVELPPTTLNDYFYVWVAVLSLMVLICILFVVQIFSNKSQKALDKAQDALKH